ncbi:MAG: stage V sporulation protein AD [Moorellales bacterium]
MEKRVGKHTIMFASPPVIAATASIVGPKEGQGPLGPTFDKVLTDTYYGESSWEKAEQKMLAEVIQMVLDKAGKRAEEIQFLVAGDLLNQTISANYSAKQFDIPFLGLYGACSTMFEGLALAAMLVDGGYAENVIAATSSHYGTSERQFRFPTEQGTQRPLSAQWTVTGAAALLISRQGEGPRITHATVGRVLDLGVRDTADLGSAMAPAAVDTLVRHFRDTNRRPQDYSLILTGDLGRVGQALAVELARAQGYDLAGNYSDCGVLIYSEEQDVHAGGSGCACSAVVTAGYLLQRLAAPECSRVLTVGTGALFSPISVYQGGSIPCIGHAVVLERVGGEG